MENSVASQLPEADSLPDGFVDSSAEPLTRSSPTRGRENRMLDYKEEILIQANSRPDLIADDFQSCPSQRAMLLSEGDGIRRKDTECKNAKRAFNTEQEFLEFTLSYQKVISERDAAISMRDKLESLCRELQHQNKMLMDECKRVSTESQNLRLELSDKFQKAIKDVTDKLEEQRDDSLTQLKENERLRNQLKQKEDQIALIEQQHAHQLKQKSLELQIADLKIQQYEESVVKSNEVFETFKEEIEKMSKSIKDLKKENSFLKSKTEKSDFTLVRLVEEREDMKKQLEKTKNQKEKLESLCRLLQAERKQDPSGQSQNNEKSKVYGG